MSTELCKNKKCCGTCATGLSSQENRLSRRDRHPSARGGEIPSPHPFGSPARRSGVESTWHLLGWCCLTRIHVSRTFTLNMISDNYLHCNCLYKLPWPSVLLKPFAPSAFRCYTNVSVATLPLHPAGRHLGGSVDYEGEKKSRRCTGGLAKVVGRSVGGLQCGRERCQTAWEGK